MILDILNSLIFGILCVSLIALPVLIGRSLSKDNKRIEEAQQRQFRPVQVTNENTTLVRGVDWDEYINILPNCGKRNHLIAVYHSDVPRTVFLIDPQKKTAKIKELDHDVTEQS